MQEKDRIMFKGSHPDSLYRVAASSGRGGRTRKVLQLLRWPAVLVLLSVTLALFVYFLMPDTADQDFDMNNATYWEANTEGAHSHHEPSRRSWTKKRNETLKKSASQASTTPTIKRMSTKTPEIDFYNSETENNNKEAYVEQTISMNSAKGHVNLPVPPVFPTYIAPEVQYGNEKADIEKHRTAKLLVSKASESEDTSEDLFKPHITQKPEKPLAIYFQHDDVLTGPETINISEIINQTKTYEDTKLIESNNEKTKENYPSSFAKVSDHYRIASAMSQDPEVQNAVKADVKFTSGHSKLFGISIEDAEKMQSTTPNSVYNTRVSPTLPVWRDVEDATNKYPVNTNSDGQPQCRSTRLTLCRGVLPYDLASVAVAPGGVEVAPLVAQLEHLVETNCSNRARQFACALLEPECNPPPYPSRLPCYHLCSAINEECEGLIPQDLRPVFECALYPRANCVAARSPCNVGEFLCSDGTCISKVNVCDRRVDCPAGDDESSCPQCAANEFSCPSGGCVVRRWVCDGYADCPNGEDESDATCHAEAGARLLVGEQSEASDPAPARLPHPLKLRRPGDSDELLITSDSSNTYRRNYTRSQPSLSRLMPYTRKLPQRHENNTNAKPKVKDENISPMKKVENNDPSDIPMQSRSEQNVNSQKIYKNLNTPMSLYDITKQKEKFIMDSTQTGDEMPNTESDYKPITRLDKAIGKLERIIKGAELMTKAPPEASISPIEGIQKPLTKSEELYMISDVSLISAHASPCPSSELRCVDGRCITLTQLCDGIIDCSDHADEDNCYT